IVDDCSKDNSFAIIESYAKQDDRIKTSRHHKNLGIAQTINDGLEAATGKYFSFIGSDDVLMVNKLEAQLKIIEKDDDLVVWSEMIIIDKESRPTGKLFTEIYDTNNNKKKSGFIFDDLLKTNYIA